MSQRPHARPQIKVFPRAAFHLKALEARASPLQVVASRCWYRLLPLQHGLPHVCLCARISLFLTGRLSWESESALLQGESPELTTTTMAVLPSRTCNLRQTPLPPIVPSLLSKTTHCSPSQWTDDHRGQWVLFLAVSGNNGHHIERACD